MTIKNRSQPEPQKFKVPFNLPYQTGGEIKAILKALRGGQISGDGFFTEQCSRWLENYLGLPKVLLTPSCTHALELAFLLLDIKSGDEIILPSFTFPSTANAFVLRGARPSFVDIRRDTLNMDETAVEEKINSKTRAIATVHYGGIPCEMDWILRIAKRHGIPLVEDAAQALGATYHGQLCGTFGSLNAFSFHETKNITCGEGGALAITGKKHIQRAEIIRQKGTDRSRFFRGEVDKYSWVDVGSSYVPSELQAAFLFAQLKKQNLIYRRRRAIFQRYYEALKPRELRGDIQLPFIPPHTRPSYHLFYVIFSSGKLRNKVLSGLRRNGIDSVFHYFPLHLSKMGRHFGYRAGDFPVTERVAPCLIRLPIFNSMTEKDQSVVIKALLKLF